MVWTGINFVKEDWHELLHTSGLLKQVILDRQAMMESSEIKVGSWICGYYANLGNCTRLMGCLQGSNDHFAKRLKQSGLNLILRW